MVTHKNHDDVHTFFVEVALFQAVHDNFDYQITSNVPVFSLNEGEASSSSVYTAHQSSINESFNVNHRLIGRRVLVPVGRTDKVGVIVDIKHTSTFRNVKLVNEVLDPVFSYADIQIIKKICAFYNCSLPEFFSVIIPKKLKEAKFLPSNEVFYEASLFSKLTPPNLSRAKLQKNAFELILHSQHGLARKLLLKKYNISAQTIQSLLNKSLIQQKQTIVENKSDVLTKDDLLKESGLALTCEQSTALEVLLSTEGYACSLLFGVTGSGKTEVFLQWCEQILLKQQSVLILVPEINLSPQTLSRFFNRFNAPIHIYHSDVSDKIRGELWHGIGCEPSIIIGTRSAVLLPIKNLGAIILDEEHDGSFKQSSGKVRYSARDIALFRANAYRIPVLLASATPSLESYKNAKEGKYQLLQMKHRANAALPKVHLIKNESKDSLIDVQLQEIIHQTLGAQQQVLIFINQRGYSPKIICYHCKHIEQCKRCDAALSFHQLDKNEEQQEGMKPNRYLACHHCGCVNNVPKICGKCNSSEIFPLGYGTQRIEADLKMCFPNTEIFRIDRDNVSTKTKRADLAEKIKETTPKLLIGTQMLAKGHDFSSVGSVIILNTDGVLYSSNFKAQESAAQLMFQVSGRAGRRFGMSSHVYIQTMNQDVPILQSIAHHDYEKVLQLLLGDREATCMPPFSHLVLLRSNHAREQVVFGFLNQIKQNMECMLVNYKIEDVDVYGPIPDLISKKNAVHHMSLVFKSRSRGRVIEMLRCCRQYMIQEKLNAKFSWSFDYNPVDF